MEVDELDARIHKQPRAKIQSALLLLISSCWPSADLIASGQRSVGGRKSTRCVWRSREGRPNFPFSLFPPKLLSRPISHPTGAAHLFVRSGVRSFEENDGGTLSVRQAARDEQTCMDLLVPMLTPTNEKENRGQDGRGQKLYLPSLSLSLAPNAA